MTADMLTAVRACKQILAKLAMLADAEVNQQTPTQVEGPTGSIGLRTRQRHGLPIHSHPSGSSSIPRGVDMRPGERAPSKELSLHAHYLWLMRRAIIAEDHGRLLVLAAYACRDYAVRVEGAGAERHEYHAAAVRELVKQWEGEPALEAAVWLGQSVLWVRRQRIAAGVEPELGGEADVAAGLRGQVCALKRNGATTRAIAAEVGVSQTRVCQLLAG